MFLMRACFRSEKNRKKVVNKIKKILSIQLYCVCVCAYKTSVQQLHCSHSEGKVKSSSAAGRGCFEFLNGPCFNRSVSRHTLSLKPKQCDE